MYDSPAPLLEATVLPGPGRKTIPAAPAVIWTTQRPVKNDDPSDTPLGKVGTTDSDGTVFRIVRRPVTCDLRPPRRRRRRLARNSRTPCGHVAGPDLPPRAAGR